MKYFGYSLAVLLAFSATTRALPVQQGIVPDDAKWLVHLDVDSLRESKVGNIVIKDVLAKPLAKLKSEMKIDGQLILQKLHSLTAFGTDFQKGPEANGVLMLNGDEEVQKIVEGFLAAQALQDPNGGIKKLQDEPFVLYSAHNQLFVSPQLAGHVVLSKSRQQIESLRNVLAGKARTANASKPFSGYATVTNSFFFLAVAEGFNEKTALPPQAQILKKATGARIVLGERGDLLFANLSLKAKDPEVIQQIQQVLEGLKALATLAQSENKELLELAQATKVSADNKMVSVNVEYPLSKVIDKLDMLTAHLQESIGEPTNEHPPKPQSDEPVKPGASAKSDAPAKKQ
jgi:hypothetical protein